MTVTALVLNGTSANNVSQRADSAPGFGALTFSSSTTLNREYYVAMRFTDAVPTVENLRLARLQIATQHNFGTELHFTCRGDRTLTAGGSPVFTTATKPSVRWATATAASWSVDMATTPDTLTFTVPDATEALTDIIAEVLANPGYVAGGAITLLFHCSTTISSNLGASLNPRLYTFAGGGATYAPRLLLTYGPLDPTPATWEQLDAGDSMAAILSHDGFEVGNLTVFGLGATTVGPAAAGMQSTTVPGLYDGDRFRGYETPATIERVWSDSFGATAIDVIRREHAIYGTTLGQWHAAIADTTGGLWGDITVGTSLRYRLANPSTTWRMLWGSFGANDMHAFGASHLLVNEWDPAAADAEWLAHVAALELEYRDVLDHVYLEVAADPDHLWTVLPGYPNFCPKKSNTTPVQYFPQSGSPTTFTRDTFRTLYTVTASTAGATAIGGAQWTYDCSDTTTGKGDGSLAYQSAYVRAAAAWQVANDPAHVYNPSSAFWSNALAGCGATIPLLGNFWNYGGVDRWNEGWRNVTDITVNARFRMLDAMLERLAADYPRVIFLPARQSMGIDPTYSVDPSSPYAQAVPMKYVEGIHPTKNGLYDWVTQPDADGTPSIVDRAAWWLPWLQRFSADIWHEYDGTEHPVTLEGASDGATTTDLYVDWRAA